MSSSRRSLPPPPPSIPSNFVPVKVYPLHPPESSSKKAQYPKRLPMSRPGFGSKGNKISLLTNHFQVKMGRMDGYFYNYSVGLFYEDGHPVDVKGMGRKVIDAVKETYDGELGGKHFAYDGEKSLFSFGSLPDKKLQFTVVLADHCSSSRTSGQSSRGSGSPSDGDRKRLKRQYQSKTIRVEISFAAKIPLQAIADALRGRDSEYFQEGVRVLDILLRQHAAKQGCLLVRQSFFHNNPKHFCELGGGVLGCRGIHSSFRAVQGGLSLNMDTSTTMIVQPGPVVDFLLSNQNIRHPDDINWTKAKRMLKSLMIKTSSSNREYKITGLSDKTCRRQMFMLKHGDGSATIEITVYDYFVNHRKIELRYSADMPCINVGKQKRPTYFPVELCSLISLQRYTKSLSNLQRASLVEKSRQKPKERMGILSDALKASNYNDEPMLRACGISIDPTFTHVEGRVLSPPKLKVGNGEDIFPRNGRWNFNNKRFVDPAKIGLWAVVNFSARCDIRNLCDTLIKCGQQKGISIDPPFDTFEENPQFRRASPSVRVEKMFELMKPKLPRPPKFILCILPMRKNCDVYGPWKRMCLSDMGIMTQCIAPARVTDQYITNVLLKINVKLNGMNSLLNVEHSRSIPIVSERPTLIMGMDVSHGQPGRADVPSTAAVVSSRNWPCISQYRAAVRTQSPKVEMIASLFEPTDDGSNDKGIMREVLNDFYVSSNRRPDQIIIFRDGVGESQFNQVLNVELDSIIKACRLRDETWEPKFTLIVAQKNHHTKFFQTSSPDNVPPGTVIDKSVCHPRHNDFYMCAQAGMIGTSRPTHYHVLHDEIGFSADNVQELVHSLSYVYQRSTTAVSVVAPIYYAHHAAAQVSQFVKFDDLSESASSHGGDGITCVGGYQVPQLPELENKVRNSMFFC